MFEIWLCNSVDDYLSGVSLFKHLCEIIKHLISCCSESQPLAHIHKHTPRFLSQIVIRIYMQNVLFTVSTKSKPISFMACCCCCCCLLVPFDWSLPKIKCSFSFTSTYSNVYLSLVVMYIIAIRFDFERFSIFSKSPLHTNTKYVCGWS